MLPENATESNIEKLAQVDRMLRTCKARSRDPDTRVRSELLGQSNGTSGSCTSTKAGSHVPVVLELDSILRKGDFAQE